MMFFDPLYLVLIGPTMLLAMWAQFKVKGAYTRWAAQPNNARLTGAESARRMLHAAGLDLAIEESQGSLSDHYDPRSRTLRLSPDVYHGRSVAALGIACHEAGHAIQHAEKYPLLQFRSAIVPFTSVGSWLAWPLIIGGMLLSWANLAFLGVVVFGVVVLFQLVTLPVEFDASARAKDQLRRMNMLRSETEVQGVAQVLNAAAMTYVAATVTAVMTLLYFLLRTGLLGSRD